MRSIVSLLSGFVLVAGCSSNALTDTHSASDGVENVGASEAAISTCGASPKAPVCNISKCTPDGWVFWPVAKGTACVANGHAGKCDGGETVAGSIDPLREGVCKTPIRRRGVVNPKFFIVSVAYAPPGTTGSGPKSSVTYANGSSLGTTTSTEHTFTSENHTTAESDLDSFLTIKSTDDLSIADTTGTEMELRSTNSLAITVPARGTDGVNHDDDVIYLWVNPSVDVVAEDNHVSWTLSNDGPSMTVQYVFVSELKNPSTMRSAVKTDLAHHGITEADFGSILAADPFANGSTAIDPKRFVQTTTTLPYEPPLTANEATPSITLTMTNETTTTSTYKYKTDLSVGFSIKLGTPDDFVSWFSGSIENETKFTWTDSGSTTNTEHSDQSASVTITGPSVDYAGSTEMAVYFDTLYRTFLFAPVTDGLSLSGSVVDAAGKPMANQPVLLTVNGAKRRTVTGPHGEYRFYGAPTGSAQVLVSGISRPLTISRTPVRQDFAIASSTSAL
jgi:hypothetical protein